MQHVHIGKLHKESLTRNNFHQSYIQRSQGAEMNELHQKPAALWSTAIKLHANIPFVHPISENLI